MLELHNFDLIQARSPIEEYWISSAGAFHSMFSMTSEPGVFPMSVEIKDFDLDDFAVHPCSMGFNLPRIKITTEKSPRLVKMLEAKA